MIHNVNLRVQANYTVNATLAWVEKKHRGRGSIAGSRKFGSPDLIWFWFEKAKRKNSNMLQRENWLELCRCDDLTINSLVCSFVSNQSFTDSFRICRKVFQCLKDYVW